MNNSNQDNSKFEYQMPNKYLGEEFERDMHELHKTLEYQQSKEQQTAIDAANQAIKSASIEPSVFVNPTRQQTVKTTNYENLNIPEEINPAKAIEELLLVANEIHDARQKCDLTREDLGLAA